MIIIQLLTAETRPQYARKPFLYTAATALPAIPATYIKADAKQFKTVKQAHAWLARRGFMKRTRKAIYASGYTSTGVMMPELFWGFELLFLDNAE